MRTHTKMIITNTKQKYVIFLEKHYGLSKLAYHLVISSDVSFIFEISTTKNNSCSLRDDLHLGENTQVMHVTRRL